ncbi:MAG: murein biosynthesis integral membrane protein MurJ [Elusimicrobia bacterium RIFOXYA2_FULL_39_19]|nr:MAG: murein biosynthesis integral membrane protein MurJ [Elusimicrobia bacterium RIFOXYA2_FULL_39_19]
MSVTEHKKITKFAGSVSIATGISRILGYIRDMLVAQIFGAGIFADAFYAAYRIPNLFRRLLGEGSVSTAFVPVFSNYLETKTKEETQDLLNNVFTALFLILLVITALGMIFAGPITKLIAFGFTDTPEKMEIAVILTRLMFPFLLFACLAALMLGVLNSLKKFFLPAVAPASLSIAEVGYVFLITYFITLPDVAQIKGLAISVVVGGLLQYVVQQLDVFRYGFKIKFSLNLKHPGLREVFTLIIPTIISFSADQINAFVDTICASFLAEGSITALYYSNRLMQLPLALFGIAMATVSLPLMSQSFAKNDMNQLKKTLNFSLCLVMYTLIPATIGLIVIGLPIIRLLFEHGKFSYSASLMTYSALAFFSLGLLAYSFVKILVSVFYSMKETKIPVRSALIAVAVNVVLSLILMWPLGVGGLALATSVASYVNMGILFYYLRKRIGLIGGAKILESFFKVTTASAIMGVVIYLVVSIPKLSIMISVPSAIILGVLTYFVSSRILKIEERKPVFEFLKIQSLLGDD